MNLAVLVSGSGSNLQAMIHAAEKGVLGGTVKTVISDRSEAFALQRARNHGIEAIYLNPRDFSCREDYDQSICTLLEERAIELIALAGFMRLLSPVFVRRYPGQIMNIHPSLLPAFPGLDGVKQALDYGVKVSGCTVHFVDEGLDTGPIILQEAVPVLETDHEETLHQRIHQVEHRLYPRAISLFMQGRLTVKGRRCIVDEG
jgi:phosphoribosylglycinamide formyltransferase 1